MTVTGRFGLAVVALAAFQTKPPERDTSAAVAQRSPIQPLESQTALEWLATNHALERLLKTDAGTRRARVTTIVGGDDCDATYVDINGVVSGLVSPMDSDLDFLLTVRRYPALRRMRGADGRMVAKENFYIDNPPKLDGFEKGEVWEIALIPLTLHDVPRGWWLVGFKNNKVQLIQGTSLPMPMSEF